MYKKYYDTWLTHSSVYGSKVALLYQVGGFFEIYDTENLTTGTTQANIRQIADICQLSLTQHDVGEGMQTLFGGFPEHALAKFERILVQAGWTVVVVVQKKGATGVVEDRVVDHIASPGCYVDSIALKERRLVGCILESLSDGPATLRRLYWAAAAFDMATGRIWFAEGTGSGTPDRLHQFLCMHPPSELVLWSDGLPAASSLADSLQKACDTNHLRCLPSASAAVEESILQKYWHSALYRSLSHKQPQARRALSLLMTFAADHVPSSLRSLKEPELWIPEGEVRLGNAALEQLGLVSLRDEKQSLLGLMDRCRSVAGRRLMRSRLMRPLSTIPELERRLDRIEIAAKRDPISTERGLRGLYDISRLWRRMELGSASMNDVGCLLRSFESAAALGFIEEGTTFLKTTFAKWSLESVITVARDESTVPVRLLPFKAGAYPATEELFAEGAMIRSEAEGLCEALSSNGGTKGKIERLYLDDAEGGGFRITGTKRRINAILTVLRDGGDLSAKQTPYKTSAMIETAALDLLSNRHRSWMRRWIPAWSAIWTQAISSMVAEGSTVVPALEAWCACLDLSWTLAEIAKEWHWTRPTFVADAATAFLDVERLRHPILERLQTNGVPYVSHSIALKDGDSKVADTVHTTRGFLLYGMNASGKSSLMKAIGLSTLLAQSGFPVPASRYTAAPFTSIFTRILGNDNLWAGLSSFAVEMTEFREILRYADTHSLVLGDELCSGTESLSATALVAAGVEHLAAKGTKFVFATHLHELVTLPLLASVKAVHLKVHYDAAADRLVYDRRLLPGSGSALYGLEVCRALDLPSGYLDRATALRKTLAGWTAPAPSSYSAAAVVDQCAICSSTDRLEMHHIRPQKEKAAAAAEGVDLDTPGNLVCLCAGCHDRHHGGTLIIKGWEETVAGRTLIWSQATHTISEEIVAWIREQRLLKIKPTVMQRMAKQIFDVELTPSQLKKVH